jgi:hypothetical protein
MGDGETIIGNHGPADPTLEAIVSMIETASEALSSFEHTDAPFNAVVPVSTSPEPRLMFMLPPVLRFVARFGQDNALDPEVVSELFVHLRMDAPISTRLSRWPAKLLEMMLKGWLPLGVVSRIAIKNAIVADNPAIDFIEPDLWSTGFSLYRRRCPYVA